MKPFLVSSLVAVLAAVNAHAEADTAHGNDTQESCAI